MLMKNGTQDDMVPILRCHLHDATGRTLARLN